MLVHCYYFVVDDMVEMSVVHRYFISEVKLPCPVHDFVSFFLEIVDTIWNTMKHKGLWRYKCFYFERNSPRK